MRFPSSTACVVAMIGALAAQVLPTRGQAPFIIEQPQSQSVMLGSNFTLSVVADGAQPLSYRWIQSSDTPGVLNFAGSTSSNLTINNAPFRAGLTYWVWVTNLQGGVTSAPATITILSAPIFTQQPLVTNRTWLGQPARFSAVLTGTPPYSCQWQLNGTNLPGITNLAWTNEPTRPTSRGDYRLIASNAFGVTTSAVSTLYPDAVIGWGSGTGWYGVATNPPLSLSNAVAIHYFGGRAQALKADGTVAAWTLTYHVPSQTNVPPSLTNVVEIAAGKFFNTSGGDNIVLRKDGTVANWGNGWLSVQLTAFSNSLAQLRNVQSIEADDRGASLLMPDGTVQRLSSPSYALALETNKTNVILLSQYNGAGSSGFFLDAVLRADGTVRTFGVVTNAPAGSNIVNMCFGTTNGIFLKRDGTVEGWRVQIPPGLSNIVEIGQAGTEPYVVWYALKGDGGLAAWGVTNEWNPLWANRPSGLSNISAISGGSYPGGGGVRGDMLALLTLEPFPRLLLHDALDTPAVVVSSRSSPQWFGQTNVSHDGVDAARSARIEKNTASSMRMLVSGPLVVSYWWKVSCETNKDYLSFSVRGVEQERISGESGWVQRSFNVPAGDCMLVWTYSKDGDGTEGDDLGWVDEVVLTPIPAAILSQPADQSAMGGATVTMTAGITGTPPMTYQWLKNGTNLPGANAPGLTLTNVTRANSGRYALWISNALATAQSSNATLTVRVPQRLGNVQPGPSGDWLLWSGDADGGWLLPGDAANFEAQSSTNLLDWLILPNALSVSNGLLWLHDTNPADGPLRFYRLLEH